MRKKFFSGEVKVAISINYKYIVDALSKNGYEVVVAHPLKESNSKVKIKSDKIDAKILADLAIANLMVCIMFLHHPHLKLGVQHNFSLSKFHHITC